MSLLLDPQLSRLQPSCPLASTQVPPVAKMQHKQQQQQQQAAQQPAQQPRLTAAEWRQQRRLEPAAAAQLLVLTAELSLAHRAAARSRYDTEPEFADLFRAERESREGEAAEPEGYY